VDRHIAEAKNHIARQKEFIERLKQDGDETDLAEKWLDILEDTLTTFEHHRETHSEAAHYAAMTDASVALNERPQCAQQDQAHNADYDRQRHKPALGAKPAPVVPLAWRWLHSRNSHRCGTPKIKLAGARPPWSRPR
jgi:hypothetical protein